MVVVEGQLAGFHALVPELGQVAGHDQPGAVFDQQDGDAGAARRGVRIGLAEQGDRERRALEIQVFEPLTT